MWSGRTEHNEIVHLEGASDLDLSALVDVRVLRANRHSLVAELTPSVRAEYLVRHPGTMA